VGSRKVGAKLHVPISVGELADKATIVAIRLAKVGRMGRVYRDVYDELKGLEKCFLEVKECLPQAQVEKLLFLRDKLRTVNEELWDLEDEIRCSERNNDFGERFIEIARQVYKTNDSRAELKASINELTGSNVKEHKNYERYDRKTNG
jgi:hypothetical protein